MDMMALAEEKQARQELTYGSPNEMTSTAKFLAVFAYWIEWIINRRQGVRALYARETVLVLVGFTIASYILEPGYGEEMIVITLAAVVALWVRRMDAWNAVKTGSDDRHTYYMGESIVTSAIPFPLPLVKDMGKYWFIQRFVHPVLVLALAGGVYLTGESLVVTALLVVTGLCLFFKNGKIYEALLNSVFDTYDSTLERHQLPGVMDDREGKAGVSYGMPVTPMLQDVMSRIPTPDMSEVVNDVMSTNGHHQPDPLAGLLEIHHD